MGVSAAALGRRHLGDDRPWGCLFDRWIGCGVLDLFGRTPELAMVAIDNATNGVAEIAQQVPAIRNLDRLRRALADAVCIGTGAIACDHLDARVLSKPCGERLSLPVRK